MVTGESIPFVVTADSVFGPPSDVCAAQAVVLCVDAIYAPYGLVTLTSLLKNTVSRDFDIVVLSHQIRTDQVAQYQILSERFNVSIRLVSVQSVDLERLDNSLWWTTSIYMRWIAPFVIHSPTILYMDSDLIVESDVISLFNCKSEVATFGGVEDRLAGLLCRRPLGLSNDEPFLNTGVLLIDAEKWRSAGLSSACLDYARKVRIPFSSDQDILNVVGQNHKYMISEEWNIQAFSYGHYNFSKKLASFKKVGIIHFSGEVKPWMAWADPLNQSLYRKYVDDTVPKDFWIQPRTIREQLLLAQVRERSGDIASANALRHLSIGSILAHTGQEVLFRSNQNRGVTHPGEPISDLLDREVVKTASPSLTSDPMLSSFTEEPHLLWDELRLSRAIPLSRMNGDTYLPTRYSDVKDIAENSRLFSSRQIVAGPGTGAFTPSFPPFTSDPPMHAAHRGFLAPALSARHTDKFQVIADRTIAPILKSLVDQSTCEVVSEFSLPFVVSAIGSLIGIPDAEIESFRDEALTYIEQTKKSTTERELQHTSIDRRFRRLLLHRIAEPSDDVASALVSIRHDGQVIDDALSTLLLHVLLQAGVETTAGVISFAIKHLADQRNRLLLKQPTFSWKRAVEEFTRLASPATLARRSTATSAVNGCPIASDTAILLSFAAANRDPDVFAHPHVAELDRRKNRHLAFGAGIHRCLGMHLARILIETAIKRWVDCFPAYHLNDARRVTWSVGPIRAITCLHVLIAGDASEPEHRRI